MEEVKLRCVEDVNGMGKCDRDSVGRVTEGSLKRLGDVCIYIYIVLKKRKKKRKFDV